MNLYARYGIERYWLVDAEARTLEIYALCGKSYGLSATHRDDAMVTGDVPADLQLELGTIWPSD